MKPYFVEPMEVRCPFCDGSYTVDLANARGEGFQGVLHSMSPCRAFDENDVLDFLEKARKALMARIFRRKGGAN